MGRLGNVYGMLGDFMVCLWDVDGDVLVSKLKSVFVNEVKFFCSLRFRRYLQAIPLILGYVPRKHTKTTPTGTHPQ